MTHFQADIANELQYGPTQIGYQNVHCATPKPVIFALTAKKHDHASEDRCSQPGQKRSSKEQLYKIPPALAEEFLDSVPYCVHSKPHLLHVT